MVFQLDPIEIYFPDPALAEEDGLLAIGGDLSPERLLLAYENGIFPWFSEDSPICWYAPHQRFVLEPNELKISKSMKQVLRKGELTLTHNTCFAEVIQSCAQVKRAGEAGTWITADMQEAYIKLHQLGIAHSIETWKDGLLVGGLYGIQVGNIFCGESMFSKVSNASKLALIYLCKSFTFKLIDCQIESAHLRSLGAAYMSQEEFRKALQDSYVL